NIKLTSFGSEFQLKMGDIKYGIQSPLMGLYNVYNLTAAIAVAVESNIKIDVVLQRARKVSSPKGRLQKIDNLKGAQIFVDFAHT
ncbi:hypothetical protein GN156_33255, partial [bacterium LRH843]|nr:hypothetical protein [bacterium LRH843]